MLKLILLITTTFLLLFSMLNILLKYINSREDVQIADEKFSRILVSAVSSIFIGILYLKYAFTFPFIKYLFIMTYLIVTGYIDSHSRNVYTFISYIFLFIGLIFLGIDIMYNSAAFQIYLIGSIGSLIICSSIAALKLLGWGDVEVFVIASIYIGGFISIMNIFLALSLAGIGTIYKLLRRKVKLSDRGTLCPYIAVSTYLIIFLIL